MLEIFVWCVKTNLKSGTHSHTYTLLEEEENNGKMPLRFQGWDAKRILAAINGIKPRREFISEVKGENKTIKNDFA